MKRLAIFLICLCVSNFAFANTTAQSAITDPNIVYLLMVIGLYGLIFELVGPGMIFPGVVGVICLLTAAYGVHFMPVNFAGMALMLLGVALMVCEAFLPRLIMMGLMGAGGVVVFALGSVFLFDGDSGMRVAWPIIATVTVISALFFVFAIGAAIKARRQKSVSGQEQMIGSVAIVTSDFAGGKGLVFLHGESWSAVGGDFTKGDKVVVEKIDGLVLTVKSKDAE